jgi:hypothetical protein
MVVYNGQGIAAGGSTMLYEAITIKNFDYLLCLFCYLLIALISVF